MTYCFVTVAWTQLISFSRFLEKIDAFVFVSVFFLKKKGFMFFVRLKKQFDLKSFCLFF